MVYDVSTESAVSAKTYAYSNPINLLQKWHDNKYIAVKLDVSGTTPSGTSAEVDVNFLVGNSSGGTFAAVVTGSGTSKIIASGTSSGGEYENGSYYVPLTMFFPQGSGTSPVAIALKGVPFIKIGTLATKASTSVQLQLVVG